MGQRFIVTKRVKGQRFRQTVLTNREKKSGTLSVASGTVLTFIGVDKGLVTERWRFTADNLAGVEVRIDVQDAKRRLDPIDAPQQVAKPETKAVPQPPPPQGSPYGKADAARQAEIGVAEELERFAALRDSGVLTPDEFDVQKKRLLGLGDSPATGDQAASSPPSQVGAHSAHDLYLIDVGEKSISVIKVLRDLTGADLTTAKGVVDSVPQLILESVSEAQADEATRLFEQAGARVATQPTGTPL